MNFKIEQAKGGKPNIIYNNHKYRQNYVAKSGEITFWCLGRRCNSTIKTDSNTSTITSRNLKHSGPHPVTMRSLFSPRLTNSQSPSQSSKEDISDSLEASTPKIVHLAPAPILNLSSNLSLNSKESLPTSLLELEEENRRLKENYMSLEGRLKCVLDHTIESDRCLLEFTE